ncbi:MAG: hypothetical protein CMH54_15405 [Myxococcales bacterium]|nr:hypothetical protein [Myxococcales bacterium]
MSVGLLSLGGHVLPVLGPDLSTPVTVFCSNSRPRQESGLFRLLPVGGGEPLHEQIVPLDGVRCGEVLFQVTFESNESTTIHITSQLLRGSEASLPAPATIPLPSTATPISEEIQWNLQAVRAQAIVRWYRSMLMERDSRIALREEFRRIRLIADDVDEALHNEDRSTITNGVSQLLHLAKTLEAQTGILPFPADTPLVLLPDPSGY